VDEEAGHTKDGTGNSDSEKQEIGEDVEMAE